MPDDADTRRRVWQAGVVFTTRTLAGLPAPIVMQAMGENPATREGEKQRGKCPAGCNLRSAGLSTHHPGSLYQAFPPGEARRVLRRLEFHYVPKHASWLNMVEIESVLRGQCLDRRISTREQLESEIAAWQSQRNASGARIQWMFTTAKARSKMGHAYPVTQDRRSGV